MLTELLRRKLIRLFDVFDWNGNGSIQKADFDGICTALIQGRGWRVGQPEAAFLRTFYDEQWARIERVCHPKKGISADQWLAMYDALLSDPARAKSMIVETANNLFRALDENGDGGVTRDELRRYYRAYQVEPGVADNLFESLGIPADGTLSVDQAVLALQEFYQGTDPRGPGNLLYGPY